MHFCSAFDCSLVAMKILHVSNHAAIFVKKLFYFSIKSIMSAAAGHFLSTFENSSSCILIFVLTIRQLLIQLSSLYDGHLLRWYYISA